jgi:hypothetical protein
LVQLVQLIDSQHAFVENDVGIQSQARRRIALKSPARTGSSTAKKG